MTNNYWNICVMRINKFYPHRKIIVIDDNSDYQYVKAFREHSNVEVIQSEYPGRGELLPYYYYIKNKYFEYAVILHDSVFFHKRVHFEKLKKFQVLPLWCFPCDIHYSISPNQIRIISSLSNPIKIINFISNNNHSPFNNSFSPTNWKGCFGVQSFINHSFLLDINSKYNICNLVNVVRNREDRMVLERLFAVLFYMENKLIHLIPSLYGNIFSFQQWGLSYPDYCKAIKNVRKPVVKIWTGR